MIRALATVILLNLAAFGISACSSQDDIASREAAIATATFQAGAFVPAHQHIRRALAIRDDVSDYWLLLAQIASAQGDGQEVYNAYRNVIALDRANVNALRSLCQIGTQYATPTDLDRFADQLAVLAPQDLLVITARGNAALMRGNVGAASDFADKALAAAPNDPNALILKSKVLRSNRKFKEAADLIKRASITIGASPSLIGALADTYTRAVDRPGYAQAIRDLVQADPVSTDAAIKLADLQYQEGDRDGARATIAEVSKHHPDDVALARDLIELWLEQGPDALTPEQIESDSAGLSPEIQSAYAQYATALGRPDLALKIIGKARGAGFAANMLDAQAALAEALTAQSDPTRARAVVDKILAADPTHPRGLVAHSRLVWMRGDHNGAISDIRQVVADDNANASARLLLTHYLEASGENVLAMAALREGATANPGSTRLAEALVTRLLARHQPAAAADVLTDLARAAPLDLRSERTRKRLCPRTGIASCDAPITHPDL